jgi:hypothetical protein
MEKKATKKVNKNIPHQQKQNNQPKFNKTLNKNNVRPITSTKPINKQNISLSKKSNTPKKLSVINLNEELSLKESQKKNMKNSMKKSGVKEKIKVNDSNINKNKTNISQSQTVEKNINIIEQLSNLTSLYNALEFINLKLDSTFSSQKEEAEQTLNNKYKEAIELKEKNFNLYQQINSMSNIINIDDYFLNNYQKIIDIYPKVSNVVENMNDIVSNVNYGIDRIYLVDDLLCDENILQKNIIQTKNDFEIMNNNIEKKMDEINENKKKYEDLYNKLKEYETQIKNIENKLDSFKENVLTNNIDVIFEKLSEKNKKILNQILND